MSLKAEMQSEDMQSKLVLRISISEKKSTALSNARIKTKLFSVFRAL